MTPDDTLCLDPTASGAPAPENPGAVPLTVDLDGTLLRTDTLHEALLALVAERPSDIRHLPAWVAEGRAGLKARLADGGTLPGERLPLNAEVVALIEAARAEGRPTALVSAADQRQVDAVAEATGLFDEAWGSTPGRNLKGEVKARFLVERFGAGGFDYIGDSHADLPVWKAARQGITVGAGARLRRTTSALGTDMRHLDPSDAAAGLRARLRAMRPHQWSKNLLLFLPALAAHSFDAVLAVIPAFLAFCLAASSVYVINDLVDLDADRAHPRKRHRPFASGELTPASGVVLAGGLLAASAILALLVGPGFAGVLVVYLAVTFLYSVWLKRKLLVDVLTLAGLYTIRIVAGGVATATLLSAWMLGFSIFLFLCLAAVKRQAELVDLAASGRVSSGRAYFPEDLPVIRGIAISAAQATVLVFALYIASDEVQSLYNRPEILWAICPLLLYWSLRMVMKAHRGLMPDDPIVFAASDRVSLVLIIACASLALAAAL